MSCNPAKTIRPIMNSFISVIILRMLHISVHTRIDDTTIPNQMAIPKEASQHDW